MESDLYNSIMDTAREAFIEVPVNSLGIDVSTDGKGLLISKLKKLTSTVSVMDGGQYREDRTISQIIIDTEMTESELDDWCYNVSLPREIEIYGTFERN